MFELQNFSDENMLDSPADKDSWDAKDETEPNLVKVIDYYLLYQ